MKMSKTQNITISNQSSKIYIYNTTSEAPEDSTKKSNEQSNKKTSSITIFTPDCQIQINNSFKENAEKVSAPERLDDKTVLSEVTSKRKEMFKIDDDVLMEDSDGKFYLGTVINVKAGEYLIKFDDNTEKWSNGCMLKKLCPSPSKSGVDSSLCVICKISNDYDVVEICDKCSRGYHRQCIKLHNISSSPRWNCTRCNFDVISISDSEDLESVSIEDTNQRFKLPYDISSLQWDSAHRSNKEKVYCYCGLTGLWKEKMLQCWRCRQWFHENCIKNVDINLLHGDTFYVFCCSVCNEGTEFIRRLNCSWREIIQLVFYELTVIQPQKFYNIVKDVVPYIIQNWEKLHLPPEFNKFQSKDLLEKKVFQIVRNAEVFKCSDSMKKKPFLYNLRKKVPPAHNYLQKINIPSGVLTEDLFKKLKVKFIETSLVKSEGKSQFGGNFCENKNQRNNDPDRDMEVCDSSDETSSKSTLDLIIPPPDNFRGSNNPFHINYRTDVKMKGFEKISGSKRNSFSNKFPEVRIVRTIKRRLSAKDLLVGPNQEVKRRKICKRRKSSNVEVISEIIQPINMPLPTYIPLRSESTTNFLRTTLPNSKSDSSRKQQIKCESAVSTSEPIKINLTDTVTNSPVKNNSINMYFGAMNRIDSGEKFTILAKRITFDGKKQYLLDWDCKNSTVNMQNES